MNEISKNFEAYAFFGIMVLGLLYIPLVVVVASKAHAASPALPRCDKARTIDQVRGALEAQSGKVFLGCTVQSKLMATMALTIAAAWQLS